MDKELCRREAQDRKFYVYTHVSHCTCTQKHKHTNNQCSVHTSAYVKQGGGQSGQRALWREGGLTLESICPGNVGIYAVAAHFRPPGNNNIVDKHKQYQRLAKCVL